MRQELAAHALAEVARLERLERCSLTPKDETSTGVLLCGKLHEELEEVARMVETLAPLSDATASPVDDLLEYDGELWKLCTNLACTRRCAGRKVWQSVAAFAPRRSAAWKAHFRRALRGFRETRSAADRATLARFANLSCDKCRASAQRRRHSACRECWEDIKATKLTACSDCRGVRAIEAGAAATP